LYVGPTNKTNIVTRLFPATDDSNAAVTLLDVGMIWIFYDRLSSRQRCFMDTSLPLHQQRTL
jgi:hypothetical protein